MGMFLVYIMSGVNFSVVWHIKRANYLRDECLFDLCDHVLLYLDEDIGQALE
jgi:hypothetical protein